MPCPNSMSVLRTCGFSRVATPRPTRFAAPIGAVLLRVSDPLGLRLRQQETRSPWAKMGNVFILPLCRPGWARTRVAHDLEGG